MNDRTDTMALIIVVIDTASMNRIDIPSIGLFAALFFSGAAFGRFYHMLSKNGSDNRTHPARNRILASERFCKVLACLIHQSAHEFLPLIRKAITAL